MGVFGHGLGHFHRQAVQIEVVLVAVILEPERAPCREAFWPTVTTCRPITSRSFVVDIAEEIGDAFTVFALAGAAG